MPGELVTAPSPKIINISQLRTLMAGQAWGRNVARNGCVETHLGQAVNAVSGSNTNHLPSLKGRDILYPRRGFPKGQTLRNEGAESGGSSEMEMAELPKDAL